MKTEKYQDTPISAIWFGFFVKWNINLRSLFNAKSIRLEEQQWCYLTHNWEDKRAHTFPNGICPKANVIARLAFEIVYNDSVVQRFSHYTTKTPLSRICIDMVL